MGKYATYRLRGGGQPLTAPLDPPPAPTLDGIDDELVQLSGAVSDVGGIINLEYSFTGVGGWVLVGDVPWEGSHGWGNLDSLDEGFYRAWEVGNGADYAGTSEKSETFEVIH
jgi:hypothetical protein